MTSSGLNRVVMKPIVGFLERHLPNRTKRLIFITSLGARMKNTETFDNATLHKLNQVMTLSSNESALKLPVQLSRAIWRGKSSYEIFNADVQETIKAARIKEMAVRAIKAMPAWLRYDRDENIEKDVVQLLSNSPAVLGV